MSKRKPDRQAKPALISELTLIPRSPGQTTASAYRQSLEASPTFTLDMPKAVKKKRKKK